MPGTPLDEPTWIDFSPRDTEQRMPNFIRTPVARDDAGNEAYRVGGLVAASGKVEFAARKAILEQAVRLEAKMWNAPGELEHGELWFEPLAAVPSAAGADDVPAATNVWENPSLPAGYTYLLQLVAHDLVDSAGTSSLIEPVAGEGLFAALVSRNTHPRSLMLDTVYGAGPDQCPAAYSTEGVSPGRPRTRLRVAPIARPPGPAAPMPSGDLPAGDMPAGQGFCPFLDVARSRAPEPGMANRLTEALIADARGESNAIAAQLTALFHLFHNRVLALLPEPDGSREGAYRHFLCARHAVTLVYRNVIEHDVLPRILHPAILAAYQANPGLRLHNGPVPLEFAAGAFRFGHALVRNRYRVNGATGERGLPFSAALGLSARRNPARLPIQADWAVDWALFFSETEPHNLARRIGPFHAGGLMQEPSDLGRDPIFATNATDPAFRDRGLPTRDLQTSAYAGLWSVPALTRAVRDALDEAGLDANLLPEFPIWEEALRAWLQPQAVGDLLTAPEIERLATDPPLPFFTLFEAAHGVDPATGRPLPARLDARGFHRFPGQGGRHLGPLGSIIVADVIFAALRERPFGFAESEHSIRERLAKVAGGLLGEPAALDPLTRRDGVDRPLATMLDVLTFLKEQQPFPA